MAEFSVNLPFKTSDARSLRLHLSYIISHFPLSRHSPVWIRPPRRITTQLKEAINSFKAGEDWQGSSFLRGARSLNANPDVLSQC